MNRIHFRRDRMEGMIAFLLAAGLLAAGVFAFGVLLLAGLVLLPVAIVIFRLRLAALRRAMEKDRPAPQAAPAGTGDFRRPVIDVEEVPSGDE